jgi:hypothetical protein
MKMAYVKAALATIVGVVSPTCLAAQTPTGVLVSAANNQPVPYGTIIVGAGLPGRFTDATGQFVIGPGSHRVRASTIGFWPLDTTVTASGVASPIVLRLRPLVVDPAAPGTTLNRCRATGLGDAMSQPVLALLRENVDRYHILLDEYPFRYQWEERRHVRVSATGRTDANRFTGYTPGTDSAARADTASYDSRERRPYAVGSVVYRQGSGPPVMALPTLSDLADSSFQAAHCFAFAGAANGELRIDFRPADSIHAPDVAGAVYLDAARYIVRRAVFRLTHPDALSSALSELTVTTTFQEVAPLIPILAAARTEQQLHADKAGHATYQAQGGVNLNDVLYSTLDERLLIDEDRMLGHSFLGDTIGSLVRDASRTTADNKVSIAIHCTMPPSFETADIPIYATLAGPGATDQSASAVLTALRPMFHMPNDLELSVYGFVVGSKVAQTLDGQVAFTLDAGGHATQVTTTATSLSPAVDAALVAAVQNADAGRVLARLRAGRYTLSLSSATPQASARSLIFARIAADVLPLARPAALDPDSTQPPLPVGGTFQFVVDERGRAMPGTLRTLTLSPDAVTAAAIQALPALRFRPALAGECPIKQEIMLTGSRGP